MENISGFKNLSIIFFLGLFYACTLGEVKTNPTIRQIAYPVENFTELDKPTDNLVQTYNFISPWGYERTENAHRSYPLLVSGMYTGDNLYGEAIKQKYPSFYLNFNAAPSDALGVTLANLIDAAHLAGYRINEDQIYLTGFSQGGSGSFKLVRGMLLKGKIFAGILRFAGQTESILPAGTVDKTSLWYHIGLLDDPGRIAVARETYQKLKNDPAHATAIETMVFDQITGKNRTTWTLTKNGIEIVKLSEYEGMGHEYGPCYGDPAMVDWLFNQSLTFR